MIICYAGLIVSGKVQVPESISHNWALDLNYQFITNINDTDITEL